MFGIGGGGPGYECRLILFLFLLQTLNLTKRAFQAAYALLRRTSFRCRLATFSNPCSYPGAFQPALQICRSQDF
jgi:hypothetical protein